MLRRWVLFPLKDVKEINNRLDVVDYFFRHPEQREEIRSFLDRREAALSVFDEEFEF